MKVYDQWIIVIKIILEYNEKKFTKYYNIT